MQPLPLVRPGRGAEATESAAHFGPEARAGLLLGEGGIGTI